MNFTDDTTKWTAHDIEIALWTYYILKTLEPDLLKSTMKRKAENCESETKSQKKRTKVSD